MCVFLAHASWHILSSLEGIIRRSKLLYVLCFTISFNPWGLKGIRLVTLTLLGVNFLYLNLTSSFAFQFA